MPSPISSSSSLKGSPDRSPNQSSTPTSNTSSWDSSSTVKVPSPLNPATPPMRTAPLSFSDLQTNSNSADRSHVHSFPPSRSRSPSLSTGITRVASQPIPTASQPLDIPERANFSVRSRSASPGRRSRSSGREDVSSRPGASSESPPHAQSQSWWSSRELIPRPWNDPPKRQKTVPPEQTERWISTRQRVANAAASVLGTTGDVAHEVLLLGADALKFAPLPGLEIAAQTLLTIWDSLQLVDMNRLACLRLTERCADILLSIREEIFEAGDSVGQELHNPIVKLVAIFARVDHLLQKQIGRPFIKRYLKRDEILRSIQGCDNELNNALGMFSLSIQIRILRQVQDAERQRQADTEALIHAVLDSRGLPVPPKGQLMLADHERQQFPIQKDSLPSPTTMKSDQVADVLQLLRDRQNEQDRSYDMADLRQLMRTALQTRNDVEMIEVLQVGRPEMPEAIKTLQRALEREVEREQAGSGEMVTEAIPVFSQESADAPGASLERSGTFRSVSSQWSKQTHSSETSAKARDSKDTLHREFLESGIDALRRMSKGAELTLPPWTITRYEVDRDEKIGVGFFSDVYKGTWRERIVAIKVLAPTTPQRLFVHEVEIWKNLVHPNVLELLGASSASGEAPWFFVSPYLKNGSLVTYLKGLSSLDEVNSLRMIYEIAKGMEYLHHKGVLHGDLKAANVLVDDDLRCVISDFGQSEMKSEVYRISGSPPPHGTLRWQAPELMKGQNNLTPAMDVYAFAISCVEILTKGDLPWPHTDDDTVRYFVLKENQRPQIPPFRQQWNKTFADVIVACWHQTPASRPPFSKIVLNVKEISVKFGCPLEYPARSSKPKLEPLHKESPDMRPKLLPLTDATYSDPGRVGASTNRFNIPDSALPEEPSVSLVLPPEPILRHTGSLYTHPDDSVSSVLVSTPETQSEYTQIHNPFGYESPRPLDETLAKIKDERRYRLLLQHEFHPSLTLPLWSPSPVAIGAVGYLSKPEGSFITLFNAFNPPKSSEGRMKGMAPMDNLGKVNQASQRQDKRNPAQRGLDAIQSWISSRRVIPHIGRRYSFSIRAGHKTAFLCTESTVYKYIDELGTPKKWFTSNVDEIMGVYGEEHQISKEDLYLVIGTLNTPDHALFVSHNHPDGQVHFNVYGAPKTGQPWGEFSMDTDMSASMPGGPHYYEEPVAFQSSEKISTVNTSGKWKTILLARLRFKPDIADPTSQ